ncbi:MAG TPA: diacylglycerol kinase family protein [Chloroflexota bacterium]|nr:diacylglycerol kinase family protein [Chloroflexota bacterium]
MSKTRRREKPTYGAAARARAASFRYAIEGVRYALGEPNFRIHLMATAVVLIAAALLRVSAGEWLALILVSLAVLLMEMLNTTIEALVDIAAPEYHPLAKVAKDVAAGAVLIAAVAAVIVGIYVFTPHLLRLVVR